MHNLNVEPLISVGIPTYNGGKFLAEAIQSVLDQSYTNLELVVLDNCSTDNTASIVKEFQVRDPRVKHVRHSANIGFIKNFNLIAKEATGDYVLLFADDDVYDKEYIRTLWAGFQKHPAITLSTGTVNLMTTEGKFTERIDNFKKARVESTVGMSAFKRVARIIRYGHNREWCWGIVLGIHKKEALLKHPFSTRFIDPGTQFYRSIILEGDIVFNEHAVFNKRLGGLSDTSNYGRSKITVQSKYADLRNEWRQLCCEIKIIFTSRFSFIDKLRLFGVFASYRMLVLFKRIFIFTASLFIFIFIKKPVRFFKSLAR